ncbi:aminotransferase class I/II-fold pyridoxal phosphate-dependent enzyme [Marinomonas sp. 15G1-11]|uniref:Aminotransferase class I/II-fold pyridoxal phosphate-dependent enzyme n=1 Tax=Marinomonas phaeophyticola TaxID=3004091 RepID=A0ABT4JTS2_9GAMM|nr:aminotransferase class I/II-fold pyridoxal phosphate-dependent enzyme [Marinomonas sp. 15G1-11]MCZ2721779.1 aminotransferase class I/II-fold pyridoxal phosphate-dependent enzyme [Marinomonas sp. 15G1-11]
MTIFKKSFTQQESIPEEGIEAAIAVMRSGRLHRYNTLPGEKSEVDLLELEFAEYLGVPYCLACSSGGYALHIAMRAAGLQAGEKVLCNAFTLAPVPGAIHNSGGVPVLVDVAEDYCIDLDDLEAKAAESGAKYFMLSHMRGHVADMDRIMAICERYNIFLIEDCAHTMGASWNGVKSGTFGDVACFSAQTYKHMNSGEGGFLTTRHPDIMAKAVMHSGSYMLFDRHFASPSKDVFDEIRYETPNYSGRMDNLRAAILRPQLAKLDEKCASWNRRYTVIENILAECSVIRIPTRPDAEVFVGSSIQFSIPSFSAAKIAQVIRDCEERGVVLKWFGNAEPTDYTSRYDSWRYIENMPNLPKTRAILATLLDIRIPLTFSESDCELISHIIVDVVKGSE